MEFTPNAKWLGFYHELAGATRSLPAVRQGIPGAVAPDGTITLDANRNVCPFGHVFTADS